ncbi:MAG: isoprenylcysteine carboxylmethyltransferase family protein [Lentimicrobiaceae bacterium]|nr:isoprenylcysteine carboxylmethyltransferase family protein [Lentimicrobiaceae bacterium]
MNELQFYTTFKLGWLNAWIPLFTLVLIQFVYMFLFKEGGKRAVDTSWYTPKDKRYATISTILQWTILILSLFIPLKVGTAWFLVGCLLFAFAMAGMIAAFHAYVKTPRDKPVRRGIYRHSRNPMYFFFTVGVVAACIASASLWLLILAVPFILATHGIILGEERYCEEAYGQGYLEYKKRTARYFGRRPK